MFLHQGFYRKILIRNFIEIEDFGTKTLFDILKIKKVINLRYTKEFWLLLIKLQNIKVKKIKNFKKKFYKIPIYSKSLLLEEVNLFFKWYVPHIFK